MITQQHSSNMKTNEQNTSNMNATQEHAMPHDDTTTMKKSDVITHFWTVVQRLGL